MFRVLSYILYKIPKYFTGVSSNILCFEKKKEWHKVALDNNNNNKKYETTIFFQFTLFS